jgi:hypothetical protein
MADSRRQRRKRLRARSLRPRQRSVRNGHWQWPFVRASLDITSALIVFHALLAHGELAAMSSRLPSADDVAPIGFIVATALLLNGILELSEAMSKLIASRETRQSRERG